MRRVCHFERSEKSAFPTRPANSRFLVAPLLGMTNFDSLLHYGRILARCLIFFAVNYSILFSVEGAVLGVDLCGGER